MEPHPINGWKNEGVVALIKKEMSACGALQLMQYHCIIHHYPAFSK